MPGTTFLEERIFGNICLCFSLCCALSRNAWNNSLGGEIILLEIAYYYGMTQGFTDAPFNTC